MTTDTKPTEYADGLRALAAMIDANPGLDNMLSYALQNIAKANLTYNQLDALAVSAATAGATVRHETDSRYRFVYVTFGDVTLYGYGPVQRDHSQECPTCGRAGATS